MRGEINFSATAITDMVEIREWYSEKGVAEVGQRLVRETVHRVEALKDHPELGRVVPEFGQMATGLSIASKTTSRPSAQGCWSEGPLFSFLLCSIADFFGPPPFFGPSALHPVGVWGP